MEKEVLTLHLAEPWYSMIVSAEKMEEYREIKPHWIKRLTTNCEVPYDVAAETHYGEVLYRPYTHVLFVKGYPKGNKPSVEKKIVDITIGKPKKGLCLVFSSFLLEKRCGAVCVNDSYLSFILWFCNVLSKS